MRQTKFGIAFNPLFVADANYGSTQNEALAFVPQSTANDICLNAAIKINEQVGQYGAKLIGLVHDATYVECPEETVEECSRMMEHEMQQHSSSTTCPSWQKQRLAIIGRKYDRHSRLRASTLCRCTC